MTHGPGLTGTDPNRRQAEYFCGELHRRVDGLDLQIGKLTSSIARLAGVRVLHQHLVETQRDMQTACAERIELCDMLRALGHPYPCQAHMAAASTQ